MRARERQAVRGINDVTIEYRRRHQPINAATREISANAQLRRRARTLVDSQ